MFNPKLVDCCVVGLVTMCSCVAAVEALFVDEIDGGGSSAVEKSPFVVCVFVLHLQLFLHQLVAVPQCRILDPFNLPIVKILLLSLGDRDSKLRRTALMYPWLIKL